jgi:hypothetical protein
LCLESLCQVTDWKCEPAEDLTNYFIQEQSTMMKPFRLTSATACKLIVVLFALCVVHFVASGQEKQAPQSPAPRGGTSYGPVNMDENPVQLAQKMKSAKPEIEHQQQQLFDDAMISATVRQRARP